MTLHETHAEALRLYDAGLLPIPIVPDGSGQPLDKWAKYRDDAYRPFKGYVSGWFMRPAGMAVLCGKVSDLEALDFDNHQTTGNEFWEWLDAVGPVRERLVYWETPSHGFRAAWRLKQRPDPWPNKLVLAYRHEKEASIELLSQCLCFCPGGDVRQHRTGRPYRYMHGHLTDCPRIDLDEREHLLDVARSLGRWRPEPAKPRAKSYQADGPAADWWASDDFNNRATWPEILDPHGWVWAGCCGETDYWRRPGRKDGISASTNYAGSDVFFCWSTSTNFEPEKGYAKWAAYAVLNHTAKGKTDFSAAAKELARLGYGRANRREAEIT